MKNLNNVYFPNDKDPWSYVFIGPGGIMADSFVHYLGLDNINCVIPAKKGRRLRDSFLKVYDAFNETQMSSFKVMAALYGLMSDVEDICRARRKNMSERDKHIYNALKSIRNIGANTTADKVARECGLHRVYLSKIIKQSIGLTLQELIIVTRLFVAQDYLKFANVDMNISEISILSGYSAVKYFKKLFKNAFGVSPAEYRRYFDRELLES